MACPRKLAPRAKAGTPGSKYAGGHRIRVTPVPIPNTEVKPDTADGTARETVWESRSLPALFARARSSKDDRAFFVCALPLYSRRLELAPPRRLKLRIR